jgi:hypothetical protein
MTRSTSVSALIAPKFLEIFRNSSTDTNRIPPECTPFQNRAAAFRDKVLLA